MTDNDKYRRVGEGMLALNSDCASYTFIAAASRDRESAVIPDSFGGLPVTAVGDKAFEHCRALVSVSIPEGVRRIGDEAFYLCTSLAQVNIPSSVTEIGDYAFYQCGLLTVDTEAEEQPCGWHERWSYGVKKVNTGVR